jgi:hypothetical protein
MAQEKPRSPTPAEIAKLIEQLDSKSFREREQASRKLLELDDVTPELDAATKSPSPETARRATLIVEQIRWRNREKYLQRELAQINQMGVDFFLDRMVFDKDFATAARWKMTAGLVDSIAMRAGALDYGGCVYPRSNWPELPLVSDLPPRGTRVARVAIDGGMGRLTFFDSLIISAGSLGRVSTIRNSIMMIDGDLSSVNTVQNSVLICLGDIGGSIQRIDSSIVLATGKVSGANSARNSFFQAAGLGKQYTAEGNVYVNLKQVDGADPEKNQFVQSKEGPLTMLKWFDPASLGVKLTHLNGEARVDSVADGKPFAKAGVQAGDVIVLLDGRGWVDVDHFNRDLRRALVRDSAKLMLHRGEKTIDVQLRLAE